MADFTTSKINGDVVSATEWNQLADIDNAITTGGQTPSTGNLNQLGNSMANYSAQGSAFGTDSGAADAYVITQVSPFRAPSALRNGMTVRFRAANANTGATTINAFGLGVIAAKKSDGSTALAAGDIPTTEDSEFRYDGTVWRKVNAVLAATESVAGIAEIATAAEAAAATSDTTIITPLKQRIVQVVNTLTGAVATGTTITPMDDTIPQNTEGNQFMTLAITPTNASNKLKIDVVIAYLGCSVDTALTTALFQDSTANAIAAAVTSCIATTRSYPVAFSYYMTAGTTSSTTFKVRAGGANAGTTTFNGDSSTRRFGGVLASSITITEIKA